MFEFGTAEYPHRNKGESRRAYVIRLSEYFTTPADITQETK